MKRSMAGQGLVEYALILVLIAVVIIVILTLLGTQVNMVFARILLQLEHPGDYSGDPVGVNSVTPVLSGGWGGDRTVTADVDLSGAGGTPVICARFNDSNHGSKIDCGSPPQVTFPIDGSGNINICVLGVENHSLIGGPHCGSTSY